MNGTLLEWAARKEEKEEKKKREREREREGGFVFAERERDHPGIKTLPPSLVRSQHKQVSRFITSRFCVLLFSHIAVPT